MIAVQEVKISYDYKQRVDAALDACIPTTDQLPNRLHQAIRYALLNGGKRLRPALVYATGEVLGVDANMLNPPACAIECIHAYSLIHDDLPAMDNDDWRRGKPTCHKAFDEATAILAGDALQTLAFECLADTRAGLSAEQRLRMISVLVHASGSHGMAGGQALDLAVTGQTLDLEQLEIIYRLKTGALISGCIKLGLIAAGREEDPVVATPLRHFARALGLAFQIQDDILDVEGNIATLGKQPGSDHQKQKPTYPALVGLAAAKNRLAVLYQETFAALDLLGEKAEPLRRMTTVILNKHHEH